ncbi:MAG: hypothetical protein WC368_03435 [Candidatus Cloacimonadaceae bacterium]
MRRSYRIILLLLLLCLHLGAKHSDEFMIGTYSYITNSFPFFFEHKELLSRYMQEMGYNSNVIETNKNDKDLEGLLATLDKYGIDAWITDRGYSDDLADDGHYAITPLATSSYQRFEAEYLDEKDLHPGDGKDQRFWYASRNDNIITRTGAVATDSKASNGYVWRSVRGKDKAGYAMGDLRYRWPNINGYYVRFGHPFHVYQKSPPAFADDYFWITYRFKLSDIAPDAKPDTELLRFEVLGFELEGTGFAAKATPLMARSPKGSAQKISYTVADHERSRDKDGFVDFVVKIPYKDLIDANLLKELNATLMVLDNLNARMYWQGNCNLELDYVEIEDQLSRELRTMDSSYRERIVRRARELISKGKGNVNGLYAFDEPFQGQFNSYRLLMDIMAEADIEIISATYDYQHMNIVVDKENDIRYNHLLGFLSEVKPRNFAPDIYPLIPGYSFSPGVKGRDFIQDVLDRNMLQVYEAGVRYCEEDSERKFYPIVQAFGRWAKGNPDYWIKWILPPYATQKALLYLPLVYQPDGVLHYRVQSFQAEDGSGDYVGIAARMKNGKYMPPVPDMHTMDAIKHSNPKVHLYGSILKDKEWLDAGTIMTEQNKTKAIPKSIPIKAMYVKDQAGVPYSGYIQCGYYVDEDKTPYLMLVNRRGDYFKAGDGLNEDLVPPEEYDRYYTQADPQMLNITLDRNIKGYTEHIGLLDPFDNMLYHIQDGICSIEIPAGEAKLLKLVNTLPAKVEGLLTVKGETVVADDVSLQKYAKLKMSKDATVTLLPGARLIAPENTYVVLAGNMDLQGDSELVILGNLKEKNVSIKQDDEARVLKQPQAKKSFLKRLLCID